MNFPGRFFLEMKKGKELRGGGKPHKWAVTKAWLLYSWPGRLQESGRWPLSWHMWLSLAIISLRNIIKDLRLNHLFVLGGFFWSDCLSQRGLLVIEW